MTVELIQAIGNYIIVPICSVAALIAFFYFLSK
jgi:hypothetical protein